MPTSPRATYDGFSNEQRADAGLAEVCPYPFVGAGFYPACHLARAPSFIGREGQSPSPTHEHRTRLFCHAGGRKGRPTGIRQTP